MIKGNDRINGIAVELGYCCAKSMLVAMQGEKHKAVAKKTGMGISSIRFNRYNLRDGKMKGCRICTPREPQQLLTNVKKEE